MNTSAAEISEARTQEVRVTKESVVVELVDGRTLTVPLAWYPRLEKLRRSGTDGEA